MRPLPLLALLLVGGTLSCRRSEAPVPPSPTPASVLRATLVAVEGDVRLKRASANDYATASRGTTLAVDDRISTGAGGHATLLFDDGTTAVVTPRSLVSIEPPLAGGGSGALQVESGRVDLDIVADGDTQFRVNTPGADAAMPAREIMVVGRKDARGAGNPVSPAGVSR